ncbi:C25 family cysteine peptidase [candidate division KSB1 bacterium]
MIKRIQLVFLLGILSYNIFSQFYGNEWINYNQHYYRFNIVQDGVVRIYYSSLQASGFLTTNPAPEKFQVFGRGEEQFIRVSLGNDGIFNSGDYIEFYAEKNDGWLDERIYENSSDQGNPYYSLFNDTASYYVTFHPTSLNNKRIIEENDINFNNFPLTSQFFYYKSLQEYHNSYFLGDTYVNGVSSAPYTAGEGWFDAAFSLGNNKTKNISTSNLFTSGPVNADIEFVVAGASNFIGLIPDHHLKVEITNSNTSLVDTTYDGYRILRFNYSVPLSSLGSTSTSMKFSSINDLNSGADRNAIAWISITYPHTYNLENQSTFTMMIPDAQSGQTKSKLLVNNLNTSGNDSVWIYDLTNNKRIRVIPNGSGFQALVPNSGGIKKCVITSESQIQIINQLTPVGPNSKFTHYLDIANTDNINYLIITHPRLMAVADAYRAYRNSSGFQVLMADIEQLYDQYSYGVRKNPLAIKNFIRFALNQFNTTPEHLFLIGKSYRAGKEGNFPSYRNNDIYYSNTLVPTMGMPPSDILLTSGIVDNLYQPAIATGRLSVKHPDTLQFYLSKVIQYEAHQSQPEEWMKNVLHFGSQTGFLKQLTNIIEKPYFGGNVRTFLKTSSAPIQYNLIDSLKKIINKGVSIMTFFGHAAGVGFDISVDHPSEYNNYGKYPFILANSCWAGDIFSAGVSSNYESSSEEFVLIKDKGAIGYLSSVTQSLSGDLNIYANEFYRQICKENYGKTLGKCVKETIKNVQNQQGMKETCYEMTLHADPAIRVNSWDKPEYALSSSGIFSNPINITTEIDSFDLNIVANNIGKAYDTTIYFDISRSFSDQSKTDSLFRIRAPYFRDTITLRLPIERIKGIGKNTFHVSLDLFIDEIDEYDNITNNTASAELYIKSADVVPVYPHEYAIIPQNTVTLKASVGYPFSSSRDYIFEIDTTDEFNSSSKIIQVITQASGVVKWNIPFTLSPQTVYYWRVSINSQTGDYNWRESSFQHIPNKTGWGQTHNYQFKKNRYQYVFFNRSSGDFEFINNFIPLKVQTGVYPNIPDNEVWYKINTEIKKIWTCINQYPSFIGLNFAVFDTIGFNPWISHNQGNGFGQYGNVHCTSYDQYAFDFYTNTSQWQQTVTDFINIIPDGYYVLGYSFQNHNAENYTSVLYNAFESIGSGSIKNIQNSQPYVIFGRKGSPPGTAHEEIGSSSTSIIHLNDSVFTKWNEGFIASTLIGPAKKWHSLHWNTKSLENPDPKTDMVKLDVIGYKMNGQIDTLIKSLSPDSTDIYNLFTIVDSSYTFLQFYVRMKDDVLHTPAQLTDWKVIYDGVPETAINPSYHLVFNHDTIDEGDYILFSTATENISNYDMDSLLVSYQITGNGTTKWSAVKRLKPHPSGDILIDSITAPTQGLSGLNSFWIEVNPINAATGNYDQLEQTHFNNIGELFFYVRKDKINPILDVTFDGIHILDGDIVSSKPEIQIALMDENRFFELNDTSSFRIWIARENLSPERIFFWQNGQEKMRFIPAQLPDNKCRIEYEASFPNDGKYQLMIQARDISGNISGDGRNGRYGSYDYDYQLNFEVINKSTITEVLNWPNPFSTSTRFVFTLTGSEIPSFFMIQILTISGKVVREIRLDEIGPINIGRNITEYAWNGRDEFGDQLANGIYLYRVITNIQGNEIEKNNTSANKYFVKDFGKMVLIR